MARHKIVEERSGEFYVYKKGWFFWKCVNPIDYHDYYLGHLSFRTFEEAYEFYVGNVAFEKKEWLYG